MTNIFPRVHSTSACRVSRDFRSSLFSDRRDISRVAYLPPPIARKRRDTHPSCRRPLAALPSPVIPFAASRKFILYSSDSDVGRIFVCPPERRCLSLSRVSWDHSSFEIVSHGTSAQRRSGRTYPRKCARLTEIIELFNSTSRAPFSIVSRIIHVAHRGMYTAYHRRSIRTCNTSTRRSYTRDAAGDI